MEQFQNEVQRWCTEAFGVQETLDTRNRSHRFTEEALELAQATGTTKEDATALVNYVYARPVGEVSNEVGGVALTLAALCTSLGLRVQACAEAILPYAWANIERVKAKRASRTDNGPLPGHSDIPVIEQKPVEGHFVVDIREVERCQRYLRSINDAPLENITWMRDGQIVEYTPEQIEHWKFIGLSNKDFPFMQEEQ